MDRLKTILVGIDFSLCSTVAFRQAARIAAWNKSKLHALYVINIPAYRPVPHPFIPFDLPTQEDLVREANQHWESFAPDCAGKGTAEFIIAVGSPRGEIVRAVETVKPDLLVLGTHSSYDRKRGIGRIAAGCVKKAQTKILLVREEQTVPFTNVAACIDFSATSLEALTQAVRVAVQNGSLLHIVHMYDDPWRGMARSEAIKANMPDFDARMKEAVVQRLRTFSEPLVNEMKVLKVHYHAVRDDEHWVGQPGGLIGFINREGIELAVLGVRSSWNITDFLMGSTAERVCRDTACSILTVRSAQ